MFAHGYFPSTYFAETYYPPVSGVVPPAPTPGRSGLGGDDVPRPSPHRGWNKAEWKKRVKDNQDAVERTLQETYAALTHEGATLSVLSKVDSIVQPVSKRVADEPLQVDWSRLARNYARAVALLKLYEDEIQLQAAIDDEDDILMLL